MSHNACYFDIFTLQFEQVLHFINVSPPFVEYIDVVTSSNITKIYKDRSKIDGEDGGHTQLN